MPLNSPVLTPPFQPNLYLAGMGLYCFLGMLMDGPATLATSAMGLSIASHFDRPYSATSVRV
jgi:hypothetical protein